jgi:hypothetical protein
MKSESKKRHLFILLLVPCLFFVPYSASGQFKGDFEIERHYLDIENFLDWRAYQPPHSWHREWALSSTGMRASVGSISMEEFYTFNEIRFTREIGQFTTFHFHQSEESLYGTDPLYQEIEFRFGTEFGASIIGFPPHDKKTGQSGWALSYGNRFSESSIRLSVIDQYYYFNEKNKDTEKNDVDEKYLETPFFTRAEMQWMFMDRLFIKADLKQVSKAEFFMEEPEEIKTFQGSENKITLDWNTGDDNTIGVTGYSKKEERSHQPETTSEDQPDLLQNLLWEWGEVYYFFKLSGKDLITIGVLQSEFLNDIRSSYPDHRYICHITTLQIYSIWEMKRSERFSWLLSLQVGDAELEKDYIGIEETTDESNTEIKAGVGVIFMEEGNYRLFGNTTWDLDFFQTRQWDGGNVQLQILF